jgi:hypothetical protein
LLQPKFLHALMLPPLLSLKPLFSLPLTQQCLLLFSSLAIKYLHFLAFLFLSLQRYHITNDFQTKENLISTDILTEKVPLYSIYLASQVPSWSVFHELQLPLQSSLLHYAKENPRQLMCIYVLCMVDEHLK